MNREEIETLCNTGELEIVRPSVVFQHNTKNKCGNITRDGVTYPDIIELLVMDEVKKYHWGNNADHMMMSNFFPGFNDVFVVLTRQRGRHINGTYVDQTEGFGMYYSRNNYTIDEDDNYYYVTTNYDLYVHNKIVDPRVSYEDSTALRATEPTTEANDTVGMTIVERSAARRGNNNTRNHRRNYYHLSEHPQLRRHVVDNILPGIKEHACDTERDIEHVPNALTVCSAIDKRLTILEYLTSTAIIEDDTTRQYSWLEPSAVQTSMCILCTNMSSYQEADFNDARRNNLDYQARRALNQVEVETDGSHHKKNEIMFIEIANTTLWHGLSRAPWYSQMISTSESPGDLKSMISRRLGTRYPETDLTVKVLMSERAAISSYPDAEVKIALGRLTANHLTLVRVGDARKSPKGSTLMDICLFGDGVYEAIVDRPLELVRGEAKIKLEPGTYVVCVEDIDNADFLWYTRLAAEDFSNVEIREIHSRLNLVDESQKQLSSSSNASDRRLTFNQSSDNTIRSSGRFGRRRISFDNLNKED